MGKMSQAQNSRTRRRWKAVERNLAKRLRGERVPVTGRTRGYAPDIKHLLYAIEVKSRKTQFKLISEMLDQAEKARDFYLKRGEGYRLPIGIYHVIGQKMDSAYVFLRLEDFEKHLDPLYDKQRFLDEIQVKAGLYLPADQEKAKN